LPAASDAAAEAELEGHQQLAQRPPTGGEDDAEPQIHDADAGFARNARRGLPLAADVGEESGTGKDRLVEHLVGTVAVEADGGGADQDGGLHAAACEVLAECPRAVDAAHE